MTDALRRLFGIDLPILQAPMAGISSPAMAAAVSAAGGLGALGLGAATPAAARQAIADTRARTSAPFHVNFFCHAPAAPDPVRETAWITRMAPLFDRFAATPPAALAEIYPSFTSNDESLRLLLELRPAVVSFHFGLPRPDQTGALRGAGITLLATATSLAEARAIRAAGFQAVIAQGWEAGGHRGCFDPDAPDDRMSTEALTRLFLRDAGLPVIAAGGIMDGHGIRHALSLGAVAAQLGTAFVGCPESAADPAYRARLAQGGGTVMTRAISGRPARCLRNAFTAWAEGAEDAAPAYPRAYHIGKALHAAAQARGEGGYGAQWAGTGAGAVRTLPAGELVGTLAAELG